MEKSFSDYQRKTSEISSGSESPDSGDGNLSEDNSFIVGCSPVPARNKPRKGVVIQSSEEDDEDDEDYDNARKQRSSLEFKNNNHRGNVIVQSSESEEESDANHQIDEDSDDSFLVVQKKSHKHIGRILSDSSDSLEDKVSDSSDCKHEQSITGLYELGSSGNQLCSNSSESQSLPSASNLSKSDLPNDIDSICSSDDETLKGTSLQKSVSKSFSMPGFSQQLGLTGDTTDKTAGHCHSSSGNVENPKESFSELFEESFELNNSGSLITSPKTNDDNQTQQPERPAMLGNSSLRNSSSDSNRNRNSKSPLAQPVLKTGIKYLDEENRFVENIQLRNVDTLQADQRINSRDATLVIVTPAVSTPFQEGCKTKQSDTVPTKRTGVNTSTSDISNKDTEGKKSPTHSLGDTKDSSFRNDFIDLCDSFNEVVEIKNEVCKPLPGGLKIKSEKKSPVSVQETVIVRKLQTLGISENENQELSFSEGVMACQRLEIEIATLKKEISKSKSILLSADVSSLPDRGLRLQVRISELEQKVKAKQQELANLKSLKWNGAPEVKHESGAIKKSSPKQSPEIQYMGTEYSTERRIIPPHLGKKAMETYQMQKSLTVDALKQLHISLDTCPGEDTLAEDPRGLKSSITLMPHQKRALAWLLWREKQKPRGGILADDMGLGKTLTMISLILKSLENAESDDAKENEYDTDEDDDGIPNGGTLVVCPASLLNQWMKEVEQKCKRNVLDVVVHHGSNRATKPRKLAKHDIVITTYSIVRTESGIIAGKRGDDTVDPAKRSVLHRIKWHRIILDEAHVVRNHKSLQSKAVCHLKTNRRWALTGTPIQNTELDLYALLKFLRCAPFDDYSVWRRWVDNKNAAGLQRLTTVIKSIMLRRTKALLQESGNLGCLPDKKVHIVDITLAKEEFAVYEKILVFSRTLFAQFLHQRAEKERERLYDLTSTTPTYLQPPGPDNPFELNGELAAMNKKLAAMPNIKSHEILVLILRLRQLCCHPGLIKAMLDKDCQEADGIEDADGLDIDVLDKLNNMTLKENVPENSLDVDEAVQKKVLSLDNPVFDFERPSTKIRILLNKLEDCVLNTCDKAVIVSQWSSMLGLLELQLKKRKVKCLLLTGGVAVKDRMQIVEQFNNPHGGPQVLLLSLTAGGVGLNLIGGNHLFLFDIHWNPQLEAQACDRIFRVGQLKPVHIYRFVCQDTIEQRIKLLQDHKLALANDVLSGERQKNVTKLTMNDLKMLFSM